MGKFNLVSKKIESVVVIMIMSKAIIIIIKNTIVVSVPITIHVANGIKTTLIPVQLIIVLVFSTVCTIRRSSLIFIKVKGLDLQLVISCIHGGMRSSGQCHIRSSIVIRIGVIIFIFVTLRCGRWWR